MGHGRVVLEGTPDDLRSREAVRREWLEVRAPATDPAVHCRRKISITNAARAGVIRRAAVIVLGTGLAGKGRAD
jgi:hypothetical protein